MRAASRTATASAVRPQAICASARPSAVRPPVSPSACASASIAAADSKRPARRYTRPNTSRTPASRGLRATAASASSCAVAISPLANAWATLSPPAAAAAAGAAVGLATCREAFAPAGTSVAISAAARTASATALRAPARIAPEWPEFRYAMQWAIICSVPCYGRHENSNSRRGHSAARRLEAGTAIRAR